MCTPTPSLSARGEGRGFEAQTKFASLTGPQPFEGGCWERRGNFFQGSGGGGEGCNFHIKNKLKSEMFNYKKSL